MTDFVYEPSTDHTVYSREGHPLVTINTNEAGIVTMVVVFNGESPVRCVGIVYPKNGEVSANFNNVLIGEDSFRGILGALTERHRFATENFKFVGFTYIPSQE